MSNSAPKPSIVECKEVSGLNAYDHVRFMLNVDRGADGSNKNVIHTMGCHTLALMTTSDSYRYIGAESVARLEAYAADKGFPASRCSKCNPK